MGVLVDGRGPDARDPILVAAILDGVFALGQSVPKLDRLVSSSRDDLPVIGRECKREHLCMESSNLFRPADRTRAFLLLAYLHLVQHH